jgi:RimJ/RimL family protein N-acetyltransferase
MKVSLREVTADDLPVFYEHQRVLAATAMAGFPAREWAAFTAHWGRILADPALRAHAIEADGRLAGNVVSFERDGRREVGYRIGREFWGAGVASAALAAFLDLETARPLYAGVVRWNAGSPRVLEKNGFAVVGVDEVTLRLE